MTDVLKIAMDRRAKIQEEVAKLDDFIRLAESLIKNGGSLSAEEIPPVQASAEPAAKPEPEAEAEESPMRAAARRLSDAEAASALPRKAKRPRQRTFRVPASSAADWRVNNPPSPADYREPGPWGWAGFFLFTLSPPDAADRLPSLNPGSKPDRHWRPARGIAMQGLTIVEHPLIEHKLTLDAG